MAACNVYGTPVTDATLKGMTEYHDKPITAVDRARVALQMKNAEGKDTAARNFADTLKRSIGRRSLRCLIYNATGSPLKLETVFGGGTYDAESPIPAVLQNGQWACFVYEKSGDRATVGVVYEASEDPGRQWVLGWFQDSVRLNRCYAEIREKGYYTMETSDSNSIKRRSFEFELRNSKIIHEAQNGEDVIFSTIGNAASPVYEAIMTKTGAM